MVIIIENEPDAISEIISRIVQLNANAKHAPVLNDVSSGVLSLSKCHVEGPLTPPTKKALPPTPLTLTRPAKKKGGRPRKVEALKLKPGCGRDNKTRPRLPIRRKHEENYIPPDMRESAESEV